MLRKYDPIIYEAKSSLPNNHTALLRHRELKISEATSIPFKKVLVHKAINYDGKLFSESSLFFSNLYSKKVIGSYLNRSINNLKPVERYIAPQNFIEKLAIGCNIDYNKEYKPFYENDPVISTIPMPTIWNNKPMLDVEKPNFIFREVVVATAYIEDECDLYQTIYYPNPKLQLYRMSITGNKVIAEFIGSEINPVDDRHGVKTTEEYIKHFLEHDFAITSNIKDFRIQVNKYGKIKEIDENKRKKFISHLTSQYNIYSLGRFATWRNILLDDVHDDILVIQKLIENNRYYTGA